MKPGFNYLMSGAVVLTVLLTGAKLRPARLITAENSVPADNSIASCSSSLSAAAVDASGKFIQPLPGWGSLRYPVTTKSDSATFYFNQGLTFYYGYHFTEALASFKESSRFDPSCAMAYWGQALSMGPYYNTYFYKMNKAVPETVATMQLSSSAVTEKEAALINAMRLRYSNDFSNADRKQLDRSYAEALQRLTKKYPQDKEIMALYVDAVMLQHKWDFWNQDGTEQPWTDELITLCESILKQDPKHPAALHYYIHITEASRHPEKALPAADLLAATLPGIAHMVHMSSHMYQRNGLYARGVQVNDDADATGNRVDARAPQLNLGRNKSIHYSAVQSYCAMTAGMYAHGVTLYERSRTRQVAANPNFANDPYAQFVYMIPVIARVRLGKWNDILNSPQPDATWKYATALDKFARGIAFVRSNKIKEARESLDSLRAVLQDSLLLIRQMPFNSPAQSCRIAFDVLSGEILFSEGKSKEALESFANAVDEEDKMVYREPPDWLIPPRQFLGYYLLKLNKTADAETVYRQDLLINPGNGWSLLGLYQTLLAEGKEAAAKEYKNKCDKAFEISDVKPRGSVF